MLVYVIVPNHEKPEPQVRVFKNGHVPFMFRNKVQIVKSAYRDYQDGKKPRVAVHFHNNPNSLDTIVERFKNIKL